MPKNSEQFPYVLQSHRAGTYSDPLSVGSAYFVPPKKEQCEMAKHLTLQWNNTTNIKSILGAKASIHDDKNMLSLYTSYRI